MPVLQTPCDPDRLRLLADDLLPSEDVTSLEQHLEICAHCRETLDGMVSDDRCLLAARRYLGPDLTHDYLPIQHVNESLDFLAPSDWPDSLGRLGTYEVKGVLGRGGMGVVLKAFDPALNRNVAIKVLSASLASSSAARQRFLREARAAAAVVHEHVVAVYAVVESSGLPFLVMEYVPGKSLQDRLDRQGKLSLPEILRIGMQTASGLAAAHAQGLVHRDVKPGNILLEDGIERVRLADFGLARAAADALLTQSGVVAGTPHYMAPEQARGDLVDQRADLFSLGSTLYTTCTGHPPFRAESPLAVLRRVCDDEPRSIREQNPEVPPWLEQIVRKLMAKAPASRIQSAAEVAELFEKCLAFVQQPQTAKLPLIPGFDRAGRRWRHRFWLAAGAMIGVAGVTLALTMSLQIPVISRNSASSIPSESQGGKFDDAPMRSHFFSETLDPIDVDLEEARTRSVIMEASIRDRSINEPTNADAIDREIVEVAARANALNTQSGMMESSPRAGSVIEPTGAYAIDREIAEATARANALEMQVSPIRSRK